MESNVRFVRSPDVLWRRSPRAVVMLTATSADPILLGGSGPVVWELLAEPVSLGDLEAALSEQFDAPREQIHRDLEALIRTLTANGSVVIVG